LVFVGGAIGSLVRGFITAFGADLLSTLIVNVLGAAILGLIQHAPHFEGASKQAFFATGFCGGFTTLSGIAVFAVLGQATLILTIGYVALTVVASVAAYALWAYLGKSFRTSY
jgi:fluoride ion exporter CrcB/FEX